MNPYLMTISSSQAIKLEAQGAQVLTGTPQQFAAQLKDDIGRWAAIVKASGATVD